MITLSGLELLKARTDASAYPGIVEAGMKPISAVLRNRVSPVLLPLFSNPQPCQAGRHKCITCDSGPRGAALDARADPPATDHPFLADCKCPLHGAALELWMIKQTAGIGSIPQRGNEGVRNRDLAFTSSTLKVVAGAIKAASGHEGETLFQPEYQRLVHTVIWALENLHSIADGEGSSFAESFALLGKKVMETVGAIEKEMV